MKHPRTWYIIADGGRARFVERDETGAYRTVLSFVAADMHKRSRDLGLDRPARVKESANAARHAVEPRRDLHEAAKEDFIALVAEDIEAGHGRDQFDRLVLIAPPRVLTELKQKLSKPIVGGHAAVGRRQGIRPFAARFVRSSAVGLLSGHGAVR